MVGDEDGVVVVPGARIKEIVAALPGVRAAEAALEARVKGGLQMPDWLRTFLDGGRVEDVD